MDALEKIVDIIRSYAPEGVLLEILYYSFVVIIILVLFRFILHLLIRLVSWKETSSKPFKFHQDNEYDYINGWREKPGDDNNGGNNTI